MEQARGNDGRARSDDKESQMQWPQRPARPQPPVVGPRLDPPAPAAKTNRSWMASSGGSSGSRPANNNPTNPGVPPQQVYRPPASSGSARDTRETQALPAIEPSRFERPGQQPPPAPRPPAQAAPQYGRPRSSYRPPTQAPRSEAPNQPYGRKPGGWQYERDEPDYSQYRAGYGDAGARIPEHSASPTYAVVPPHGPASAARKQQYIAIQVEGTKKRHFGWLIWVLGGVLAVAFVLGLASALAWQGQYAGKVYGGVSVLGVDLGGKTPEEATRVLTEKVQPFMLQPVVFTWQGKEWRPTAEQLGIKVDVDSTVNQAFQFGRSEDPMTNVSQQWYAAQTGYPVPLTVQIDEPALQAYLNSLAGNEINQQLFEGDIRLDGDKIVSMPGKEGRTLRVYDAITAVRNLAAKLEPGKVALPVDTVQPGVTAAEVQTIQDQLTARISGPITATSPSKVESLDRDALIRFTTIQRNPDRSAAHHLDLGWNDKELGILADRWAGEMNRPAQNARFAWNKGTVSALSESADGFQTDSSTIVAAIKEHSATADKREFGMPGKVITPTVSSKDIGSLGIKELMGTGTSTFVGSTQERATNIKVAADLINGAVVPPGATFSFLQTVGGIDEAHGFVEGYVIAAERTQRGIGGGVCQVSTTVFRAAFYSGVAITERNQHSYRVGWYEANGEPVGFDAAVFDPGVDLKFVNDTPGYILVEAAVTPNLLTVNFYGTKRPGETVKLEGPAISNKRPAPPDVYQVDTRLPAGTKKQVETAHGGLDTVITRRIVVAGQADKVDQFHSSYQPWPNWYIVASPSQVPGGTTPAPNPTPNP